MQTGKGIGMQSMDDSILMHYKDGSITGETAYDYAENKKAFARMLKR
jgi:Tfp pilus assembly pilus retraction ATPase PilT